MNYDSNHESRKQIITRRGAGDVKRTKKCLWPVYDYCLYVCLCKKTPPPPHHLQCTPSSFLSFSRAYGRWYVPRILIYLKNFILRAEKKLFVEEARFHLVSTTTLNLEFKYFTENIIETHLTMFHCEL